MNTLKLQQDILKILGTNRKDIGCAVDKANNSVWLTPAIGAVALYRIPEADFYLDVEKIRRIDGVLKSILATPEKWAKPTEVRKGKKGECIQFDTEYGEPAYFDEKLLKPFKNLYKETYRINGKDQTLHVLDAEGNTKAIILPVRMK